ncbi:MAG: hypothetical protein LC130_26645 [Bryobacterales bacterium]|nr:hypothetical protein [Bryobacterales bacterium]
MIAISIWANITNFFSVIVRAMGDSFEVQMNPNADPRSAYPKGKKIVLVDAARFSSPVPRKTWWRDGEFR